MMAYILIYSMVAGGSVAIATAEFGDKKACEDARNMLGLAPAKIDMGSPQIHEAWSYCFPKSSRRKP